MNIWVSEDLLGILLFEVLKMYFGMKSFELINILCKKFERDLLYVNCYFVLILLVNCSWKKIRYWIDYNVKYFLEILRN